MFLNGRVSKIVIYNGSSVWAMIFSMIITTVSCLSTYSTYSLVHRLPPGLE